MNHVTVPINVADEFHAEASSEEGFEIQVPEGTKTFTLWLKPSVEEDGNFDLRMRFDI